MKRTLVLLAVVTAGCLVAFQNCGGFRSVDGGGAFDSSSRAVSAQQCLSSSAYSACLFNKSFPFAGNASPGSDDYSAAVDLQTVAVPATQLGLSLSNANLTVMNATGTSLPSDPATQYRMTVDSSTTSALAQVMVYYWLNFAIQNSVQMTGTFYAQGKALKVVTNATLEGWSPANRQIQLVTDSSHGSMTLDTSLAIYYLGLANVDYATKGAIEAVSTQQAGVKCSSSDSGYGCCASTAGCARALASGAAEYLVAMTFPQNPAVGDGFSQQSSGATVCGLHRNPSLNSSLSASAAFAACTTAGRSGDIYAMGTLYSSIWFAVRQKYTGGDPSTIDKWMMLHLAQLNGDDTFATALNKAKLIDQAQFGGQLSALLTAEYQARGLPQ